MKRFIRYYQTLLIGTCLISLSFLLTACGFKLRSAADVPPQLHTLYISNPYPYSQFSTDLRDLLRSLNIRLVKRPDEANYTLNISKLHYHHSQPNISSSSIIISSSYTLDVSVQLTDHHEKPITPIRALSATNTLLLNSSQIYTPGAGTLMKQQLRRDLIAQIYNWLISQNTRDALLGIHKKKQAHHAA